MFGLVDCYWAGAADSKKKVLVDLGLAQEADVLVYTTLAILGYMLIVANFTTLRLQLNC